MNFRPARKTDVPAILEIYNDAVLNLTASYDEESQTLATRAAWWEEHQEQRLPVFVAEDGAAGVVGWSSLSRFRPKIGYRFTVEDSVYIAPGWRGRGIGKLLLPPLIQSASALGMHAIVAGIDSEGTASIRLHEGFGFREVARFREVGFKFGRWLDVIFMELLLSADTTATIDHLSSADAK
jgi:L-amino acid N-acyltransferase